MSQRKKLFHKDFTLVVIGQIISLFGNAILRFALPLYLLNETGSAAYFGLASALSFIPMIFLTPIGGMIADRVNKRNIMVVLDFSTAALLLLYILLHGKVSLIVLLVVTLMVLYGIQGIYQPAVQASIPLLADEEHLLPANAVINQVSALAGLLGPVIGGILFGEWGIFPILVIGGICFFTSAVMELFIKIQDVDARREDSILSLLKNDFRESIHFIRKEKPIIWKSIGIVAGFNLFLSSMIIIGMPVFITQYLDMSKQMYGYSQGAMAAGGLCGGILTGLLAKRLKVKNSFVLLISCVFLMVPMGVALMLKIPSFTAYLAITVCGFGLMLLSTIFSVQLLSFIQGQTPAHLIGKVIAWVLTLSMCSQPVGQAMYGILFEQFSATPYVIVFGGVVLAVFIAVCAARVYRNMDAEN